MKKILITTLLFIIIASNVCNCYAFDVGTKNLIIKEKYEEELLTYMGRPITTTYIAYDEGGNIYPAYCIDLEYLGVENLGEYSVVGSSKIQNVYVWRAIINGYPYKSIEELGADNEHEAYCATKQAVYTMLYGRDPKSYGAVDSDAGKRTYEIYLNIVYAAKSSTETIPDDISISILPNNSEWQIDNLDNSYVSKTYSLNSKINAGYYNIEFDGALPENIKLVDLNNNPKEEFSINEKFKVMIPIKSLTQNENFLIKAKAYLETKPVALGMPTVEKRQSYALAGYMYEESECEFVESYYKNLTRLIIIKQELNEEKRLAGVKFNLLDSNKNIVLENLITNENGEINLENIVPGTYYLQETETLENYNLIADLIQVNLNLNEETKIVVNNTSKKIIEVNKIEKQEPIYMEKIVEEVPVYGEKIIEEVPIYEEKIEYVKKLPVTGF